jgi:hypothetical protein
LDFLGGVQGVEHGAGVIGNDDTGVVEAAPFFVDQGDVGIKHPPGGLDKGLEKIVNEVEEWVQWTRF